MKKILLLFVFKSISLLLVSQPVPGSNAGIGITTLSCAKLELHGSVVSTIAIFKGETTGISLQSKPQG